MKIIIAGAYDIGTHLAKLLSRNNQDIVLIDEDEERLASISNDYDLMTINESPSNIRTLRDAGAQKADLFIAVTPDENLNMNSCMIAHALGAKRTVARIDNPEFDSQENQIFFQQLGIDSLIYPEMLAAKNIVNGMKMSWVRQRWDVLDGALVMLGVKLHETCQIVGRPLREVCTPEEPYHIVAIKRHGETIIPTGNDILQHLDLVYFITMKNFIPYIRKIVGKEHYVDVKNVMIMGGGKTAVRAAKMLPEYIEAKIIETDPHRCEYLNNVIDTNRVMVINGDGRDLSLLTEESIKNTQAFVATTGSTETNILACLAAKRLGVRKTVAMVENLDYISMAESLDIGTIVNKKALAASHIYQMMLDADVQNIRFLMNANADVVEFTAAQGSKATRKKVYELNLPKGSTIGGLVRHGVGQLVSGNTQIEAGDIVVVYCHDVNLKKIENFFR